MPSSTAANDGGRTARRSSMASVSTGGSAAQLYGRRSSTMAASGSPPRRRSTAGASLSDAVNLEVLKRLESVFRRADADGSGQLDMQEFVAAFRGVISTPEGSDDEALRKLFMRIDANCDATVDWNEFSAYLLLEKTNSNGGAASAGPATAAADAGAGLAFSTLEPAVLPPGTSHRELISGLLHVEASSGPDKWYSAGRDGTVRVWNGKDLAHLRTFQTPLQSITCTTYLPASSLLALGGYSPCILLIDPASGEQAGKVPAAAGSAALSLTGWQEGGLGLSSSGRELLGVGDADGGVTLLEVVLDEVADKKSINRYQGKQLWRSINHHDWVVALLQLPQLNSILSASLDKKLTMIDVERRIAVKTLTGHEKSVTCCGWSGMYKMAISGGDDRQLLLWNPFSCRPLGSLVGHAAPLVAVAVNERDHQIISAAADKTIKVWDLRNQRCLQTLVDRSPESQEDTITALAYSPARRLLVSATCAPRGWPLGDGRSGGLCGHRDPVSWVGYNAMFCEAVSTDHAGTVCVWHVPSGRLRFSFGSTHGGARISAATFDNNHRRLITGAEDGTIKVWNFSSGALLGTLATPDYSRDWGSGSGAEVTGLAVSSSNQARNFIATGWDRKVTWYDDSGRRTCNLLRSSSGPSSDVLAAALMQGYPTLATACYDGEVWLWNLESGAVRRRLLPAGHAQRPENEQPAERLAFMANDLRHVLVAVGADRMLRFWDCFTGALLLEHFTGHAGGQSIAGLALAPDNSTAVTADTAGYIMVWDISGLRLLSPHRARPSSGVSRPNSAAPGTAVAVAVAAQPYAGAGGVSGASIIQQQAVWRGHLDSITALDWVPAPTAAAADAAAQSMQLSAAAAAAGACLLAGQKEAVEAAGSQGSRSSVTGACLNSKQQQLQQQQEHTLKHEAEASQVTQLHQQLPAVQKQHQHSHDLGFIVSGSLDNTLSLWSTAGALLGVFGRHTWSMDDISSWQSQTRALLKADEEFDMLVSRKPLDPANHPKQQQASQIAQQQHCCWQLQAQANAQLCKEPATATAAAATQPVKEAATSSRPQSLCPSSNKGPLTGSAPGKSAVAADATGTRVACTVVGSSRPTSGSSSNSSSRRPSAIGAMSSSQQQRPHSRPTSSVACRPSSRNSSQQPAAAAAQSAETADPVPAAAVDVSSGSECGTPRSIALVCQSSMRQREHYLATLGSLHRQDSGNSSHGGLPAQRQLSRSTGLWEGEPGGMDAGAAAAAAAAAHAVAAAVADSCHHSHDAAGDELLIQDIDDEDGAEQQLDAQVQQLMQAALAGRYEQGNSKLRSKPDSSTDAAATALPVADACNALQEQQQQQHIAPAEHAGLGPSSARQLQEFGVSCSRQQRPRSGMLPQTKSRVGFAGISVNDRAQDSSKQALARNSAVAERAGSAEDEGCNGNEAIPGSQYTCGDDDYEPSVAEDDIPSSLWLPQFGHKPATPAQQLIKAQRRPGSARRPNSAGAALGLGRIWPSSAHHGVLGGGRLSVGVGPGILQGKEG